MIDLKQYGYTETEIPPDGQLPARITAVHRERYELISQTGRQYGKLKTSTYYGREPHPFPTVGDFVLIREVTGGDCQIVKTLPRRSYFSRLDPDPSGAKEQAVAANFDTVFIMQSLNQNFNLRRLERYLALTWQSGGTPVIVLTKVDLADDPESQVREAAAVAAGTDVVAVSAKTGEGLAQLDTYLKKGTTCVFLGSSGVGKSSLLKALMGSDVMAVKEIREDDARGRHTTTHRQMVTLPSGVHIIDTPGVRELGMWESDDGIGDSVSDVFSDVEAFLGTCKFSDCRHESEPGCTILAAIENGELDKKRFKSYQKLEREAQYAKKSADIRARIALKATVKKKSKQESFSR